MLFKFEQFLDFLFNSGLLQDVAYGVEKFSNGQNEIILKAFSTSCYRHGIAFYKQTSSNTGYSSLSDLTLCLILNSLKPSKRKSQTGLDDTVAAEVNGFEVLENTAKEEYYNNQELNTALQILLSDHI